MNNEEAKLILHAYRSSGQDANDPRFRAALEQARRDPELARWFANEQALDTRISARLKQAVTPPAPLKAQLLAQQKMVHPSPWWRQSKSRYALAAGLALLATLAVFWFKTEQATDFAAFGDGFPDYRVALADFAGHKLKRLDFRSRDIAEVRRWLAQKDASADLILPAGLEGRPSLGCRVLNWQNHKVTLVCFELQNRQAAHLLVVDQNLFKNAPGETPEFYQVNDVATVSWSRAAKTYVLVCKNSNQPELLQLF